MGKKVKKRNDLISKSTLSKQSGLARVTIDSMIQRGDIPVENVCGIDYIILNTKTKALIKKKN